MFIVDVDKMKNTTAAILVLMVAACVATVAQSAAAAQSWYGRKRASAASYDAGQMVSKWLPTLTSKRAFHPGPGPDDEHAVPTKRKQVRCKIPRTFRIFVESFTGCGCNWHSPRP